MVQENYWVVYKLWTLQGAVSWEFLRFRSKRVPKLKLGIICHLQNAPRTTIGKYQVIFSKGEQIIISFRDF